MDVNRGILKDIFEKPAEQFEKLYACRVTANEYILWECFQKIGESERRDFPARERPQGYNISPFKLAGIICFWVRKLKPFSVAGDEEANRFVNEAIALYTGIYFVYGYGKDTGKTALPKINGAYIHDLIKSLRYNSHSPNSTAFVFESLCMR